MSVTGKMNQAQLHSRQLSFPLPSLHSLLLLQITLCLLGGAKGGTGGWGWYIAVSVCCYLFLTLFVFLTAPSFLVASSAPVQVPSWAGASLGEYLLWQGLSISRSPFMDIPAPAWAYPQITVPSTSIFIYSLLLCNFTIV